MGQRLAQQLGPGKAMAQRCFQTLQLHYLLLAPSKSKTRLTFLNSGTFFV
jgi:hypothetical protein